MKPEDIKLSDLSRIILGEVPWTFLIEALLRMAVLYALLVVAMRLMGKRMASQATRNELAALVSLAAAIGPAVQAPDRGLLPPIIIAAVVIGVQRAVAVGTFKSAVFERKTQGDVSTLVADGELDLGAMRGAVLSRERVFAHLRCNAIDNLGRVERVYLETNGSFSIIKFDERRPGLSLLPAWDKDVLDEQPRAHGKVACAQCGRVDDERLAGDAARCKRCGSVEWHPAVLT